MSDAVRQLLSDRKRQGSTPGRRSDDARLVLLVEGGSSRGAYSSGMTVAIEQLGLLPLFDAAYGSSAGALNAAWLLCGRAESTMHAHETAATPSRGERLLVSRWFARHAPGALEPWLRREAFRAEEERLLATHPATLQIRPPIGSARIGRTERRGTLLREAVRLGRNAAWTELVGCTEPLVRD